MSFFSGPFHGRQLSQESDIALVPYENRDYDAGFNEALSASTSILSPGGLSSKSKSFLIARDWPREPKSLKKPILKAAGSVLLSTVLVLTTSIPRLGSGGRGDEWGAGGRVRLGPIQDSHQIGISSTDPIVLITNRRSVGNLVSNCVCGRGRPSGETICELAT
jgi:hypothetical protein